ncbi:MAG: PPC domain-containing DNA-binding protein [Promethearchaeota archaeon]
MKSIETTIGRVIVAKLMPDEEIIDSIKELVKNHNIKAGLINLIGALKKITIGYFNLETKEYNLKTFEEDVELISCMGNVSYKEDEPIIHLHIVLGRDDYSLFGGHLSQPSIISVTGEVYIYEIDRKLERALDSATNLSLLDIS